MSYCKCLVGSAVRVVGKTFENKVFLEGLEQPEDALTFKKSLSPLKKKKEKGDSRTLSVNPPMGTPLLIILTAQIQGWQYGQC